MLAGNKIDLNTGPNAADLETDFKNIMDNFPVSHPSNAFQEVETCIECSAKKLLNVHELFFFAQKAVLYPTHHIYDVTQQKLKNEAVLALRRIFKLCDQDKDGIFPFLTQT